MKSINFKLAIFLVTGVSLLASGCENNSSENVDRKQVDLQQQHYQKVQPVHFHDYSIPRDIYQQIYDITTEQAVATYSVITTMTGAPHYECPSISYAIPADVSLTNPLQGITARDDIGTDEFSVTVEQAEPNGLFSSKNTNATWVLCVDLKSGVAHPFSTEHFVSTWPFIVEKGEDGQYKRADNKPIAFTVSIKQDGSDKLPIAK